MASREFQASNLEGIMLNPVLADVEDLAARFVWPDYPPPPPPPTPPPLPVPVFRTLDPEALEDDDFNDRILRTILRRTRAASLQVSQAQLYANIPENCIAWKSFERAHICRLRGCPFFGYDFGDAEELDRHFNDSNGIHGVLIMEPVTVDLEKADVEESFEPVLLRFEPPPATTSTTTPQWGEFGEVPWTTEDQVEETVASSSPVDAPTFDTNVVITGTLIHDENN